MQVIFLVVVGAVDEQLAWCMVVHFSFMVLNGV